jgi:hypothetical protein
MVMQTANNSENPNASQAVEYVEPSARLTQKAIAAIKEQMDLAENLVTNLMKFGIDYGVTPGTQGPGLWDAGAAKVIRAFHLFADHKVLNHEENDDLIHYTIQVHLINQAGEIFGSGMGAASTRETKYKYRWVAKADALRADYTEEDIAGLKTKAGFNNEVLYRIENPEYGELVNTILAMACKRAEVDAARSLPGVGSALKAKFTEKPGKQPPATSSTLGATGLSGQDDLTLPIFWSMVKGAGLTEDEVHNTLKVKSLKDWVASGKTYRDAVQFIMRVAVGAARGARTTAKAGTPAAVAGKPKTAAEIVAADIPNLDALVEIASQLWKMSEEELFNELGYTARENFIEAQVQTPWEAFQTLKEIRP